MRKLTEKTFTTLVNADKGIITPSDKANKVCGGSKVQRKVSGENFRVVSFKEYYSIFPVSRLRLMLINQDNADRIKAIKALLKERGALR